MIIIILLFVSILLLGPYFTISSLNVLFNLEIPFTIATWLSVTWLMILIGGVRVSVKR